MTGSAYTARQSLAGVYYALCDEPGFVDRRIAYLPAAGKDSTADLSLSETWAAGGLYVFLGRTVDDDLAFLEALRSWQPARAPQKLRLLWIEDPNAAPNSWRTNCLDVSKPDEQGGTIAATARIALNDYAVMWAQGCTISLDEAAAGFTLAAPDASPDKACFTKERADETRDTPPRYTITNPGAALRLRGPQAGALTFGLDIEAPSKADAPTCFDGLDVAIRYFYPLSGEAAGQLASLRYPVFDGRCGTLSLAAVLDPSAPLSKRNGFSIKPADQPLMTYFRTVVGSRIALEPQANAALRFESRARAGAAGQRPPFYLVPSGDFKVVLAEAATGARQLLCGVYAGESVGLTAADGDTLLSFVPGQAAFAPLFGPIASQPGIGPIAAPRLDFDARTSWVAVTASTPLTYYAQPASAALFGQSSSAADGLLPFLPVPAGGLPAAETGHSALGNALPLVPYAGIDADEAAIALAFETEVLAPERRELVYQLTRQQPTSPAEKPEPTALRPTDTKPTAVTPAGFAARLAADASRWESLTLARMAGEELALQDIEGPLRAALQTNQQFLVISDPRAIKRYFQDHKCVAIRDWGFDLDPAHWQRHGTIMLIKHCAQSVATLIGDVGTWTLPEEFNRSPGLTQQALERIVANARDALPDSPGSETAGASSYDYFVNTVIDDPNWNGVLFLNGVVTPAELPAELHDLAACLDQTAFVAHHLGINRTATRDADPSTGNSSLFGLITYSDEPRLPGSRAGDFDFQVLDVEVLFANSEIQHVSSSVAVTLMQMFGAPATAIGTGTGTGNTLILDGHYQHRGDRSVWVYRNREQAVFELGDRILKWVKLEQAEFGSGTQHGASGETDDDSTVVARFSFRGTLAFNPLEARNADTAFDLFSYDRLPFSGLVLEMRYPRPAPRAASFRLDPSGVVFGSGTSRPDAIASHFPIQPVAMISDADAARPSDLGFMNVSVPGLDVTRLTARWFGLVFDLDLGTPGALAGAVGFSARLALVWSPSRSAQPVFVGLKMPGSSGAANELSLMGVLKLTIYRLQLLNADNEFILKLTGMTLKVMGKTLPPGATFDFFLFGDPAAAGGVTSLGWYGAYKRPPDAAGDEAENGLPRSDAPGRIERQRWSPEHLLNALRDPPQE